MDTFASLVSLCGQSHRLIVDTVTASGMDFRFFADPEKFLSSAICRNPGCVFVPLPIGIEIQNRLRAARLVLPVVAVLDKPRVEIVEAFRAGIVDVLYEPLKPETIIGCIESAVALCGERQSYLNEIEDARRRLAQLSVRQLEVVQLIVSGRTNKWIAANLKLSLRTIEKHRADAMARLKVNSLIEFAGLIERATRPIDGVFTSSAHAFRPLTITDL